jgi:hypothetical protein
MTRAPRNGTRPARPASDRDAETRQVTADIEAIMARLRVNVAALNSILTRPAPPSPEEDERLIAP